VYQEGGPHDAVAAALPEANVKPLDGERREGFLDDGVRNPEVYERRDDHVAREAGRSVEIEDLAGAGVEGERGRGGVRRKRIRIRP
jgi:hypothetical protein